MSEFNDRGDWIGALSTSPDDHLLATADMVVQSVIDSLGDPTELKLFRPEPWIYLTIVKRRVKI